MDDAVDPVAAIEQRLKLLATEQQELRDKKSAILAKRGIWPKVIKINVGKGQWTDDVADVFATDCGWLRTEDGQMGPLGSRVVAAKVHLFYSVKADGTVKLVGAEDAEFGKVGKTKET